MMALDAGEYVGGVDDAIGASEDLVDSTDVASESLFDIDPAGLAASGALVGVATAAQSLLDDTQELNETLGRTSVGMGLTADETRDLATSLSDSSFPLDDVVGSMDELAQIGVDTEEEMREVALAADALADATGTSASEISSQLAPAVQALDGDLSAITEDADAFTNAVRNTGLEMSDVASTIERLDFSQIEEMGLSAADTADLIGRFGEESGFTGRQLRTEFRSAVEDADGDTAALVDELGLGEEAMASLADETAHGSEMTAEIGDAANDSLTSMDGLRSTLDDVRLQASGLLGPLDAAIPAVQGLGVAGIALSTINFSAVIPSITGVVASAAPLLPILLPLAGLVAGFGALWHKGWIDPVETVTWLADRAGDGIEWLTGRLAGARDAVMRFWPPIRVAREVWDNNLFGIQDTTEAVIDSITSSIDWLIEKVNAIPGVDIGGGEDVVEEADVETDSAPTDEFEAVTVDDSVPEIDDAPGASTGSSSSSRSTGSQPSMVSGGEDSGRIVELLESVRDELKSEQRIDLSGPLSIDGDVATLDDVEARLRREGRRSQNRGIR